MGQRKEENEQAGKWTFHLPQCTRFTGSCLDGVGSFECKSRLNLKDIKFEIAGVGNLNVADLHAQDVQVTLGGVGSGELTVDCDQLDANVDGVGSLTLSGKAKSAHISKMVSAVFLPDD